MRSVTCDTEARTRNVRASFSVGLLALALGVLGACEGDNLFSGDSNLAQPRNTVTGPEVLIAGDSFSVRVDAVAARGISRVDIALRGALTKDTTLTLTGNETTLSQVLRFATPTFFADTLLIISSRTTDKAGVVSSMKADTVLAFGPPGVISVTKPDSVRAGGTATLRVRLVGSRPITQFTLRVRGAMNLDSTVVIQSPRTDVSQDVVLTLPATAADTLLRVGITARDASGLSGPEVTVNIPLAIEPPVTTLTAPATASPAGMLDLRVRAIAMRGVSQIRVELRGAVIKDTTVSISPIRNDVTQDISIRLPGDIQDSTLTVRAFAVDRNATTGNVATATVRIPLGAPVILSLTSADSARGGRTFDVRVVARGIRPLSRIDIRFRGAVDQDLNFTINPARTEVTQDASITLPVEVRDSTLTISATATDVSGSVSPIVTRTVRISDVSVPTVTATVNPGQASSGSNVFVRVTASDNVGLARFGFAAINPAGDTIGTTPTLATTAGTTRDSTFTFAIPSSLTPRQVRIIGIAIDGTGLRGLSAPVTLSVVDSTFPTVNIIDPVDGSSSPLTGQLLVRARVADNSGVRQVSFKGVAIRRDSAANTTVVTRYSEVVVPFPQPPSVTLPRDTTLVRFLTPVAGDNTSEVVHIVVTATDSLGNMATDTNRITVGGPTVTLRNPVNGSQVQVNGTFQITADASDNTAGLDSMKVYITGVITDSIVVKNLNGVATRTIDQPYTVGPTVGVISVVARAWNRQGIVGTSQTAQVTITSSGVTDTQPPQLSVTMNAATRLEVDDTVAVTVRASDLGTSGLARIGITVIAIPDTTAERQDTLFRDVTFAPPRAGTLDQPFTFRLIDFLEEETAGTPPRYAENSSMRFPRRFTIEVHAFAIDAAGNCGAAVSGTTQTLPCAPTPSVPPPPTPNTFRVAQAPVGLQATVTATLGASVTLPAGGNIADALVDPVRQRLYLSNISLNRLEVLNAATNTFIPTGAASGGLGLVGSQPWGLAFNSRQSAGPGIFDNDTLIVANSGGTNLSFVPLGGPNDLREDLGRRLLTPNMVLFEVSFTTVNGFIRYTSRFFDFSDRPQFVAIDRDGLILYSTVPTGASSDGTIRFVDTDPDPSVTTDRPESKLLFNLNAVRSAADNFALANIDSLVIVGGTTTNDRIILYDHRPGTSTVIQSDPLPIDTAITDLRAEGSDIRAFVGQWNLEGIGMSDTTFIAISTDRRRVAFGEGATAQTGRILMCCSKTFNANPGEGLVVGVSREVSVVDLINNANERVLGLGLNNDGQLGVARGGQAAYFFTADNTTTNELRLQGVFSAGIQGGGGGAALHPNHTGITNTTDALAFVATPTNSIKIIDTVHFFERGNVPIRDNIVGPLRATLAFPGENGALAATDPNFIIVKLFGVASGGRVVVVNIRNKDLVN